MKNLILLFNLLIITTYIASQNQAENTHQGSLNSGNKLFFELGINYHYNNYSFEEVMDSSMIGKTEISYHRGIKKYLSTSGFQLGIGDRILLNEKWLLIPSISFNNRREILEIDSTSLLTYKEDYGIPYQDVVKYEISKNKIEAGILCGYKLKRLEFQTGVKYSFINAVRVRLTHFGGIETNQNYKISTKENNGYPFYNLNKMYYTLNVVLNLKIKDIELSPFAGIDYDKKHSWFINSGVRIGFYSF